MVKKESTLLMLQDSRWFNLHYGSWSLIFLSCLTTNVVDHLFDKAIDQNLNLPAAANTTRFVIYIDNLLLTIRIAKKKVKLCIITPSIFVFMLLSNIVNKLIHLVKSLFYK